MAKTRPISSLTEEDKIQILIALANGATLEEIRANYNIDKKIVYTLMGIKKYNMIIKERKKAVANTVRRAFSKVDNKFITIVDKYMDRLLDEERIDKTSNPALASIIESISSNYKKIAEIKVLEHKTRLDAKRYQLEKKQAELMMATKYNNSEQGQDNSIIGDFYEQLKGYATPIRQLELNDYSDDKDAFDTNKEDGRVAVEIGVELNKEERRLKYELYKIDKDKYPMKDNELQRAIKEENERKEKAKKTE